MALPDGSDDWMWEHLKVDNLKIRCTIDDCDKTYRTYTSHKNVNKTMAIIKGHLYHKHDKCTEEDRLKWENNNDLIWRYYDKVDLYKEKCKICEDLNDQAYIPNLKYHLQTKHNKKIRADIQTEIADKSLSQYYEIYVEEFSARCKRCNHKMDIFYGTDVLIHHICFKKNETLRSRQEPKDNDVNRMTQLSITNENTSTSSHHDNINTQAPGNRENQQSNTLRYCADEMVARDESDDWMWEHLKLENSNIRCNIDDCDETCAINENVNMAMIVLKGHLYHKHDKCTEEDRLKWENNNDLIWRYFDKVDLYKEECTFCKKLYHEAYVPNLKEHLRKLHNNNIRAVIQKEIADKSLSQHYEIHMKKYIAWCKRCNLRMDIFYGTDALIRHICFKKNETLRSRQEPEDNDVTRVAQQSITDENTSTSSHHEYKYTSSWK